MQGKVGAPAFLEQWITQITPLTAGASNTYRNMHHSQFYLKTVTLEDVPGIGRILFVCNSWVYPSHRYNYNRVFFANQTYLPSDTPEPLRKYREEELVNLRGNGKEELKEWDRVYDYAFYNDLGNPDKGTKYERPILGGSAEYPYPRRGRTGRNPSKTDPNTESRIPLAMSLDIYVPRDERFGHLKMSDFLAYALKAVVQFLLPELKAYCDITPKEFTTFQDVLDLYEGGIQLPNGPRFDKVKRRNPLGAAKGTQDKFAWRTDEEFAREMLAGVNPVCIRCLEEFPPINKLDPNVYGNQNSSITKDHIEEKLNGLTVQKDHHDTLMPYLRRINTTSTKTYATRTLLFLKDDGTLKPLAIELSLPHPDGDQHGAVSKVFTPAEQAYASVNDSGVHQLLSHWLNTHAVIEPFVIAMNIHKLLQPHFRDTMNINALARQILINGGGIVENTVFPSKFAMEMSFVVYKSWVLLEQSLPADLIKRGMAVPDSNSPHGLRLLIEDYPYAVDGLEIWSAIEAWVQEYCSFYYSRDEMIQSDSELQSWWAELRNEGHGDKKDEPWWPKMKTVAELTETCTIIIWIASALHAAVNFGQYPYAGYLPNRPTISHRFMPEPGSPEYDELEQIPETVFLKTITSQLQTLLGISLIEILSRHSSDEIYLGQRDTPEWTSDVVPLKTFEKFGKKLVKIENRIIEMNNDKRWKNRVGPVKIPYTLLYPDTSNYTGVGGLTGRGIPNSVSI
ncbi:hypothetical protein NE237_014222 [Protea cynaroides]|uniref:Lipoxygenase n=1 Tax=Protea cynaroides TaxID=273540 RepID=A0A9Q0GPU9_9MAGN|nr:hypothetical protein NE237_014222 [Protea cynaroides]